MAVDPRRVKALFNTARDLPAPTERSAYLDRECGEDTELRQRLDELLAATDPPASELDHSDAAAIAIGEQTDQSAASFEPPDSPMERTASFVAEEVPTASLIGSVIAGRYKIREEIGEGGMGSVYLAEQSRPIRRLVALKLIKPGMDSRAVLARFESERQALALMDHPNIAKVLDAGSTEAGRPFFVMELVKGVPITEYCDTHRLGLPERLQRGLPDLLGSAARLPQGIIHRRSEAVEYPGRKPRRQAGAQGDRLRPGQGDKRPTIDRAEPIHGVRVGGRHAALHGARAGRLQRPRR